MTRMRWLLFKLAPQVRFLPPNRLERWLCRLADHPYGPLFVPRIDTGSDLSALIDRRCRVCGVEIDDA